MAPLESLVPLLLTPDAAPFASRLVSALEPHRQVLESASAVDGVDLEGDDLLASVRLAFARVDDADPGVHRALVHLTDRE